MAVRLFETAPMYVIKPATKIYAGDIIVKNGNDMAVLADRAIHEPGDLLGISNDDSGRIGNTMIIIDPVGHSFISDNGTFTTSAGQGIRNYFLAPKRVIADYPDEMISNQYFPDNFLEDFKNRQIYFLNLDRYGCNLITDRYAHCATETPVKDNINGNYQDIKIGDFVTYGAGINAGKFVPISRKNINQIRPIGKVTDYYPEGGLIAIEIVPFSRARIKVVKEVKEVDIIKTVIEGLIVESFDGR